MSTYEERLASFAPKKAKSSKKNASSATTKGWPHPSTFKASPSSLAYAGFYYDPTPDRNDSVTCFKCENSLAQWAAGDDPFTEHLNVGPKCAWAIARCSIELDRLSDGSFVFTEASRLPGSKAMEKARADTFKGYWVHDQTKGHTANSRKMAKAGWIYNPGPGEESDIATCFYCGKSLDGWEEGDDPTHEHRTRVPNCAMFTGKLTEQREAEPTPSNPPASTTSSKAKTTKKQVAAALVVHDTATESDAPSQQPAKRGRPKKSAMPTQTIESVLPHSQASVASSSRPTTKEPKQSRSKSVRSTSVSRTVEDEPPVEREPSPEPKPKKGKGKKAKATSPEGSVVPSVSAVEEPELAVKPAAKKKASGKKSKSSARAPSVSVSLVTDDETMDVDPSQGVEDLDLTPVPPTRAPKGHDESLGGWESFQAANLELEELARELHIEGEFAAIGKKPVESSRPLASSGTSRTLASSSATLKPPSKSQARQAPPVEKPVQRAVEKSTAKASTDPWAWREREKSVGATTGVSEAEMTEEEEVEKSLAGDEDEDDIIDEDDAPDDTQGDEEEEEEEEDEPPPSLAPSTTSRAQSTSISTTVSSKTKAKIKDVKSARVQILQDQDQEMADGETPKASRAKGPSAVPSRPPMNFPVASFESDGHGSNPFLVARSSEQNTAGNSKSGLDALMAQLEAPMISRDVDSRALTEEEREMTLEEWIRYDVEKRKELIRREGRKWIETFLESAEGMREKIRAM